jgi:NADH-quinone oxidoreductase subunit H
MTVIIIATLIKIGIILGFAILLAAVLTWMERRQSAMMQDRVGPERAYILGPKGKSKLGRLRLWGLVHPLADSLKLAAKEDFVPPKSHRTLYALAPLLALAPVLLVFAVIPFGPPMMLDQWSTMLPKDAAAVADLMSKSQLSEKFHYLQVANLDIGILFVFAISSLSVYGAVLAGWSSYNNYGLLGGLRASAQMFSYEITMGMAVMGAFLVYGTLEPMAVVQKQASIGSWGVVMQPLGFLLFFFAVTAETKRAPFDLPEGESEILGYFVEYSGTRFMMFYLGEFLEIVFAGALLATLFFGGWHLPGLHDWGFDGWALSHGTVTVLRVMTFMGKVFMLCFLQLTLRWSVPRMRYDQLMKLGWKGLLPASLVNVVITAAIVWLTQPVIR